MVMDLPAVEGRTAACGVSPCSLDAVAGCAALRCMELAAWPCPGLEARDLQGDLASGTVLRPPPQGDPSSWL